jgi:hypothetical protein
VSVHAHERQFGSLLIKSEPLNGWLTLREHKWYLFGERHRLWSTATWKEVMSPLLLPARMARAAFSPDGELVGLLWSEIGKRRLRSDLIEIGYSLAADQEPNCGRSAPRMQILSRNQTYGFERSPAER